MKFAALLPLAFAVGIDAGLLNAGMLNSGPQPNWAPYYTNKLSPIAWLDIRTEISKLVADGYGPVLLRLSWHDAATANVQKGTGGPHATILVQNPPDPVNSGLDRAIHALHPILDKYRNRISNADLWSFAACVAVKSMGGPNTPWRPGRMDFTDIKQAGLTPEDNKIPKASMKIDELTAIFKRLNMSPTDMNALVIGGHGVGRCHKEFSGYHGPWTGAENTFSNFYGPTNPDPATYQREDFTINGDPTFQLNGNSLINGQPVMLLPSDVEVIGSAPPGSPLSNVVGSWFADKDTFFNYWVDVFQRLQEVGLDGKKLGNIVSCDPSDI